MKTFALVAICLFLLGGCASMAEPSKVEPDPNKLQELYDTPGIVPPKQFFSTINPKIYGPEGNDDPDFFDHLLNRAGLVTPKIQRMREAYFEEQRLAPAYDKYLAFKQMAAQGPTQEQAQAIVPNFPLDPTSLKPNPAPPMRVPKTLVPDETGAWNPGANTFDLNRMQHPGAGIPGLAPMQRSQPTTFEEGSTAPVEIPGSLGRPSYYTDPSEGTRPYQPQPFVPNLQARLTPVQQAMWKAEMQRRGLRQPSGAPQGFLEYQDAETAKENAVRAEQVGLAGSGFLGGYTPNAYGPGVNSDATGRPFIWQPDFGGPALGQIKPNAYGPGVGMDATGRPVRPSCPPGWAGPC